MALAQIHFTATNYTRALSFVTRSDLLQRSAACKYLAAHCYVKQGRYEDAIALLGDKNPVHLATTTDSARRKLQHVGVTGVTSMSARPHGKSKLPSRLDRVDRSEERDLEEAGNLKYEAGMCYLRGICFAKQNAFDRAKECYKHAVRIDVQCFEAFDQLMKNSLMSPGEEWDFLYTLNFDSISQVDRSGQAGESADFVRNLYITRLSKYARPEEFGGAIETLSSHYRMADNADVLLAKAEMMFTSSRFRNALDLTSGILSSDPYNFTVMPLHLALLHHLKEINALFALSHDLADTHPGEVCSWLAVGTYYLSTVRIPEARSYFSKASLMDPHFGPAWIGFAHTFAAEGEGDQAIAAYSTAARLFQGTHLPQMFLGMQEISLGNLNVAREYLSSAFGICDRDPLLLNEIGVVAYMEDDYDSACRRFQLALEIARDNEAPPQQYATTRMNLGQAHRRAMRFEHALEEFDEVIRLGHRDCSIFTSKGLVLLELDRPLGATIALHEGLAISPQDPVASELLATALKLLEVTQVLGGADEHAIDDGLRIRLSQARRKRGASNRKKGRAGRESEMMDLDRAQDELDSRD